jgi:two-component system cell cycle sensor histidine kinase/response regulator CckA
MRRIMAIAPSDVYRALLAASPEATAIAVDGVVVVANLAFVDRVGVDPIGRAVDALIPTALTDDVRRIPLEVDGVAFEVVQIALRARRAANASRDSEELYRAMFEVNTAIKLLIDPASGAIVHANQAACAFYGWSIDEMRQKRISEINLASPEEVHAEMERARSGGRLYFRFQHRLASGDVRHVEVNSGPLVWHGQTLLFSIIHDITDRERLEEQLRQSQKMEAVGRLAGGIAHDFNNLLTVMLGSADLLVDAIPASDPMHAHAEQVFDAASRAKELTRQLLAFSRRQVLQPRPVDLNLVVTGMRSLLARLLGAQVSLVDDLDPAIGPVLADPGQLEQVILNLVVNARDALPKGGRITLRTCEVTLEHHELQGLPAGRYVQLSVADDGVGMDDVTRGRIFEPFFTTKDRPAGEGAGTGLGLATVYGVVRQSGGAIQVDSAPGRGSTFTIHLPRAEKASTPARPVERRLTPLAPEGLCVLVVEDQDEVREFLVHCLRAAGHRVLEAPDGVAALAAHAGAGHVDVLVTDVEMPNMGGLELRTRLLVLQPKLRTVFVSGYAEELVGIPEKLGPRTLFLQKPFTGARLVEAVDSLSRRP